MIPVSLTLKGIYSYQERDQIIDFTKLSSSGLFGIFGAVGSGKSTILEAISYALYGETERLNSRDNRSYNMMNLKSDNLLIDFIFLNASDKIKYRFTAKASRKKKRFEDVNTIERVAFKLFNEEWIPISAKSAEEICGLSYINFRRTVIIPQGRFQEFLQLGDTDRSKMMKELFHLEKFDLWGKTKFLEEKNDAAIQNITGQLEQLNDISEEQILEIEKHIIETKDILAKTQNTAQTLSSEIEALKQLKALFDRIALEQKAKEKLQSQKPEIDKLKSEVQEYVQCSTQFSGIIGKLNDLKSRETNLTIEIKKLKTQRQNIANQLNKLEPVFAEIKLKYESREELKKLANDCRKIFETRTLQEEINKLNDRLTKGNKELEFKTALLEKLEKNKSELKENIVQIKSRQIDLSELAKIKSWFTQLNSMQSEFLNLEKDSLNVKNQADNYKKEFLNISDKIGLEDTDIEPQKIAEKINRNIQQIEIEIEESENELKHLKIKQGLLTYSEQLIDGEACPVCGSTHHPDKMEPTDLSEKLSKLEKLTNKLKLELKKQLEIEKELNKKVAESTIINQKADEIRQKFENCRQNLENHRKSYQSEQEIDEVSLDKAFTDADHQKKELDKCEKELGIVEKQIEDELKNKEKYQAELNKINIALSSKTANYQTLLEQIDHVIFEEYSQLSDEKLENKINELEIEYQKLIKDFLFVEKQIGNLKPEKDKLHGNIEAREKDFEQLTNDKEQLNQEFDKEIEKSCYSSITEIDSILKKSFDINSENKKITDFENQLYSVNEQLARLKQQTGDQIFDNQVYDQKLAAFDDLGKHLNEHHKKLGSLEKEKLKQEQKLLEKIKLSKEFGFLSERAENIKTLKSLFKSSGFVNYISSVFLQNLVNSANQRFQKLTGQKLRLELTETNDFIVRDYLNEGKTRSVKTLSGGQTFQAALSLALALADSIQSINKSEDNFFFLDEGFGSLDKSSLATVFESLKSLRRENRIVGIISHVEELQQEIDNYLRIENSQEEGSLVYASWDL